MKLTIQEVVSLLDATKSSSGYSACCPSHDDESPSLSINVGNDGKVLVHCHAGCTQEQVIEAIQRFTPKDTTTKVAKPGNDSAIKRILSECVTLEDPQALPAVRYLMSRMLDPNAAVSSLSVHPRLEYYSNGNSAKVYPAIVAPIKNKNLEVIGIHRIYLTPDGAKAPEAAPKKVLGSFKSGYIPFGEKSKLIHVAEGIETALSIFQATQEYTLSLISASGIEAFSPPNDTETVHIWADFDKSETGQRASTSLATKLAKRGIKVFVHLPKGELGEKKSIDWLDVFRDQGDDCIKNELIAHKQFDEFDQAALPKPLSLRELNALPKEILGYLVDELLVTSGCSLLIAKPKVGKSTLSRQIATAVATGSPFLGRTTTKGKVVYIALEEKQSEILRHFSEMSSELQDEIFVHCEKAPGPVFDWLEMILKSFNPDLVIIDPLFRFLRSKDANDYSELSNTLERLMMLARKSKAHIMCVHHARKGDGSSGDSVLGSTAILGAVDASIFMKETNGRRTIQSDHRYGTAIAPSILDFNPLNRTMEIVGTKEEFSVNQVADQILVYLKEQKAFLLEKDIEENIATNTKSFRDALRKLVVDERLVRHGEGIKGKPYVYGHPENACLLVPPIYAKQENLF